MEIPASRCGSIRTPLSTIVLAKSSTEKPLTADSAPSARRRWIALNPPAAAPASKPGLQRLEVRFVTRGYVPSYFDPFSAHPYDETSIRILANHKGHASPKSMLHFTTSKRDHGFSLLEMMIVLAVIMILAAITVPRFLNIIGDINLRYAATNYSGLLQSARIQSVRKNDYYGIAPTTLPTG